MVSYVEYVFPAVHRGWDTKAHYFTLICVHLVSSVTIRPLPPAELKSTSKKPMYLWDITGTRHISK